MTKGLDKTIRIKVFRSNPMQDIPPGYDTYEIPFRLLEGRSVLQVLQFINENYDGGLAFYGSCRRGVCVDCMIRINGEPKLACLESISGDITLEPLSKDRVIKDLLVGNPRDVELE